MERRVLTLTEPVEIAGETIKHLEFRRAKAKDFRAMPLSPNMGDMLDLAGRLCGQTSVVMDQLCPVDFAAAIAIAGENFASGPKT